MANTYEFIASSTVGSGGVSSVTFSSIANTWTDLKLVFSARTDESSWVANIKLTVNGNASSYSEKVLSGTGAAVNSYSNSGSYAAFEYAVGGTATSNTFSNQEIYIPNYVSSNNKSWSVDGVTENNGTNALASITAGLWSNTSGIISITLAPETSGKLFQQYSTFYLYGIKNS